MSQQKNMSNRSIFLIIILFLSILTTMRIGWLTYFEHSKPTIVGNGEVDLTDVTFNDSNTFPLDGEWRFIPHEYVDADTFEQRIKEGRTETIDVPGDWSGQINDNGSDSPNGKGTYYLKVKLPKGNNNMLGIFMKRIKTASNIYLDNQRIMEYGELGADPYHRQEQFGIDYALFHTDKQEFSFVFHVENIRSPTSGGLKESIYIGSEAAIIKAVNRPVAFQLIVAALLIMHALYSLGIYFMRSNKFGKEFLYFALLLLSNGLTLLIDENSLLSLPVTYDIYQRIFIFLFGSALFTLLLFIEHLFSIKSRINKVSKFLFSMFLILTLVGNMNILVYMSLLGVPLYYFTILVLFYYMYKVIRHQEVDIFILLFLVAYSSNALWRMAVKLNWVDMPFYPIDFLISIIAIALILIQRHIRLSEINDQQTSELQRMDKARDEFLVQTSHELRNPLHGIINIANTVLEQENKRLSPDSKGNLRLLSDIGKRMGYTLNDLSIITQLREDKIQLSFSIVDIHIISNVVIDMLEFMKEGKDITLVSQIPPNFPTIWADENRLIQILFNLVHNALKYTSSGSIHIKAEVQGEQVFIYVEDTGDGIDSNQIQQVFEPYIQLNTDKSHETGIGIGLSVSKQLVELHGGEITFHSSKEGTTFVFTMPLCSNKQKMRGKDTYDSKRELQEAATVETVAHDTTPLLETKSNTVLIVDDDPVNIKVLTQLLNDEYNVIHSLDPQEVLDSFPLQTIDVILSDVMMPYLSGYEFTQKVREKYTISELPILLITARNTPEDIRIAFQSGANDYLVKPVHAEELRVRVKALIHLKHYIKESQKFEAAWLQAQIQPHFLFNTLNSIAALAEFDTEKMSKVLHAFGDYLQRSFSIINLESTIPIQHEMGLIHSYIMIEEARFGDRIHIEYDFDESIEMMVPPLSIQPLVENAICHGILQKREGGTIVWRMKSHKAYTVITVSDDGVGMSKEKIKQILEIHPTINDGVGLKNTNRRLLHLYNRGLEIESQLGVGTTIRFRIPNKT